MQKIVGLDIGSYSVKAAVLERSFKSFGFIAFYEKAIFYRDVLSHDESVAIAVQSLIDDHNLTWDVLSCAVPGQRVSSRVVAFPFTGSKRIDQAVKFEIESHIPFHVEDVVIDHAIISRGKELSKVMVFYTKREEFLKQLDHFKVMNLDPRYICAEGVELVNLIHLGMMPPEGVFANIDIGHEKTMVSICHGRKLGLVRAIGIGGKRITENISKLASVPYDEAEKLKIEMGQFLTGTEGMVDDLSKNVHRGIEQIIQELLLELRQTFFAYRDAEEVSVEGVFLCGGTSRMPGIDQHLSNALKLNVSYLNVADFHFSRLEQSSAHLHVIPAALSLALKGVAASGASTINFRKGEFAFKGDVEELGGSIKKLFISIAIIIILAIMNFAVSYYFLRGKVNDLNRQVSTLMEQALPDLKKGVSSPTAALALLRSKEKELKEKTVKLGEQAGASPLDLLKEISNASPPRSEVVLDVDAINIKPDKVSLSGRVDSFESVDRIKAALETSPFFKKVQSSNVRKGVKGEIKFDLTMESEKGKHEAD